MRRQLSLWGSRLRSPWECQPNHFLQVSRRLTLMRRPLSLWGLRLRSPWERRPNHFLQVSRRLTPMRRQLSLWGSRLRSPWDRRPNQFIQVSHRLTPTRFARWMGFSWRSSSLARNGDGPAPFQVAGAMRREPRCKALPASALTALQDMCVVHGSVELERH